MSGGVINLYLVVLFSKSTPLSFCSLIFTAKIPNISFVMSQKVLRLFLIPLDRSVTIASSVLICLLRWHPFNACIWKTSFSRSVANCHKFSFVNVIHFYISIWTSCSHVLVIRTSLKRKYFSVWISKEID